MESSRDPDPIVRAATDWLLTRERGISASERAALERWLQADPRHATAFHELEQTWEILGAMPDEPAEAAAVRRPAIGRRWLPLAIPLAAAAAIAVTLLWRTPAPTSFRQSVATQIGGIRHLALPDGSAIQLNTDTAVEVDFTTTARRITLTRGEAHFTVTPDARRAFVVTAGQVNVRAVGTAFNVHLAASAVEVLVTEGKVAVVDAGDGRSLLAPTTTAMPVLVAGKKAVIPRDPTTPRTPVVAAIAAVEPAQIDQLLSWRDRQLRFVRQSLSEIAAEFNRYNRHQLVIADPNLAAKRFGGTFPSDDYASFVRVLQTEFGVVIEERPGETVLRLPEERPAK